MLKHNCGQSPGKECNLPISPDHLRPAKIGAAAATCHPSPRSAVRDFSAFPESLSACVMIPVVAAERTLDYGVLQG
jgi:hypothetical protein